MRGDRDSISSAASMNARLADACSKEFFWGCELTKEKPSVTWSFAEEDDDHDFLQHTLFLRHAILGKNVTANEKQIVEIETKNFAGDDVKQPILALTEGKTDMCQLDLNFGHEIAVTFKLVEGSGPVFLSAQQLVEFPQEIEEDEFLTATETETEAELGDEDEEEVEETAIKGKKRKANGSMAGKKKQRGKLDSDANGTEEDDEEEEEEEVEEDEEESMETTEEDEEEEADEEDDDSEEDEEESPKKKGAKGKKGKAAAGPKAGKKAKAPVKGKKTAKKGKAK